MKPFYKKVWISKYKDEDENDSWAITYENSIICYGIEKSEIALWIADAINEKTEKENESIFNAK